MSSHQPCAREPPDPKERCTFFLPFFYDISKSDSFHYFSCPPSSVNDQRGVFFVPPQLSDPAHNTQLLTEQLRSLGLYAAPTLGDGNCLFRALSDQLYGTPSHHQQLRKDICDWIEAHKQRYEPFVEDDRGLDVHLRCMRENGSCAMMSAPPLLN